MDEIDCLIVDLLQQDGRLTASAVGERIGLTASPTWRRMRRLEEDGTIRKLVALLEPQHLNLRVTAVVTLRASGHRVDWVSRFRDVCTSMPEVVEAYRVSGEADYMLKVVVPSIAAYDEFYQRLIAAIEVVEVRSNFVMETIKHTTALPLTHACDKRAHA